MSWDWLKDALRTVAPTIATALGGPMAGSAVSWLSNVLFGKSTATKRELEDAIKSADPETWAKIRKADQEFRLEMKRLGLQDVVSARELAAKEGENAPYIVRIARGLFRPYAGYLTVTVWAATVGVRFYAAVAPWAKAGFPASRAPDLAALLTGWDFGVIMLVLGFFFGTRSFEKSQGVQNRG